MESKLLVFNMKMYMDIDDVKTYLSHLQKFPDNVILCPETIYIPYFLKFHNKVSVQNVYIKDKGAYTGEVSAYHAKKMGINYTLVGHSERRTYFNEQDSDINLKIKSALVNNLKVILCIGETLDDYQNGKTNEKLLSQLETDLKDIEVTNNIIIGYEPVWAIGTGKIPTNEEIKTTIDFIKNVIKDKYGTDIKVLYGGSVNGENIADLNVIDNLDGFLIGSACTKVDEVNKMIEVVNG